MDCFKFKIGDYLIREKYNSYLIIDYIDDFYIVKKFDRITGKLIDKEKRFRGKKYIEKNWKLYKKNVYEILKNIMSVSSLGGE